MVILKHKKVELGRSLTEMLGTLAIMGILILTGVRMYHGAMNRHYANTLIQEAQKRAVVVAGQIGLMGSTHPTLGEFKENAFGGGTFSTNVTTEGLYQQFGIQVAGVPKPVCQNILNAIGDTTPIRRLAAPGNPTTAITSCTDTNTFLMVYNNDMSSGENDPTYCTNVGQCKTACSECIDGACVGECEIPTTPIGGCDFDHECNQNNKCMVCDVNTHACKDGCQRVTYLETEQGQYIDTEIEPTATLQTEIEFAIASNFSFSNIGLLFGSYGDTAPKYTLYSVAIPSNTQIRVPTTNTFTNVTVPTIGTTQHRISYKFGNVLFDGTQVSTLVGAVDSVFPSIRLFGRSSNNSSQEKTGVAGIKCYYVKMHDKGEIKRDFVPVHAPFKTDGKQNCLFDKVSKELFCNEGTGDFLIPSE